MITYIILDLEATCYERGQKPIGFSNEIIEIGAVKLDENFNILDEYNKFLKPKNHPIISQFCNELTTINQDDIDNADDAKDVLIDFFNWSNNQVGKVVYMSWGFYDKNQFRYDLKINKLNIELINDNNHRSLKHEYGKLHRIKPCGLQKACRRENIVFEGTAHRGIDDAKNIVKIFKTMI